MFKKLIEVNSLIIIGIKKIMSSVIPQIFLNEHLKLNFVK